MFENRNTNYDKVCDKLLLIVHSLKKDKHDVARICFSKNFNVVGCWHKRITILVIRVYAGIEHRIKKYHNIILDIIKLKKVLR